MSGYDFLRDYIDSLSDRDKKIIGRYELGSGRDESEIIRLAKRAGIVVPEGLREFYRFSYGAYIGEYKILTISEIADLTLSLRYRYEDEWTDHILPFAYVMGVGDFIAFDLERCGPGGLLVLDCFHELSATEWKGICFGLKNWLVQMVKNDFESFWL